MKNSFRKLLLIATFAIFTITSTCFNYCFGSDDKCNIPLNYDKPEECALCQQQNLKFECEVWFDQVYFHIHTYVCMDCGYYYVFYI